MKAFSYVRFSSAEQEKGDSLRRQVEQSEAYCQAHGLCLDDSLRLTDRGLSAFHGIHRIKGALGMFHRLVEQGEVEPGSVLLVESLDRLSREYVDDALMQFIGLIRAGIKVVTLADGMSYDQANIRTNFGQLIMSIVIMSRAHEESATKSLRGLAAWDQKRIKAASEGHKLTARCPAWLKLNDGKFEVVPEVAEAVNRIFAMKLAGKGSGRIACELNQNGNWKPANGWRKSYIDKLLRNNRALLGEFQPHRKIEGKRVPSGEPIPGYFPPIVEPELFHQVQAAIQHNRKTSPGNGGGRTGPVNNLFGFVAKCGLCGGPMAYVCKGKGSSYLVCDTARRGLGCKKSFLRYDKIEPLILTYCRGLVPSEILPDGGRSELAELRSQLQGAEGELGQVERKIATLMDSLEDADGPEFAKLVKDRVQAHQTRKAELEGQAADLRAKVAQASNAETDTGRQLSTVRELIDKMGAMEGQERVDLRLSLRNQLRRLVKQMNVFPDLGQVGVLFKSGERRLLIVEGEGVRLLDVEPGAKRVPSQLWGKPYMILNRT